MSGPLLVIYVGWSAWAALWVAASWWSSRPERRPKRSEDFLHKLLTFAGIAALLIVTRPRDVILSPQWQLGAGMEWAMVALMASGFAFACWARLTLGSLWSVQVERKQDHQLVDRGPYAIVRHPIYTGLIAAGLATAFVKATPLAVGGFLLMTSGLTIKARLEERFLAAELGQESYENYRRRVPMLVPFMPLGN
jgi:protein-S-isoprenylcysteine O-methyltransferase Ste14